MINEEIMLQGLEQVTGIKLDRDENGFVNITKFIEDYKEIFPQKYKERFGDISSDQIIEMFINQNKEI